MNTCDLHCHSNFSDGRCNPEEVVRIAKKARIRCMALTDHNSVDGVERALKAGKKYNVEIIPGVEVFCDLGECLGYFVDYKDRKFNALLRNIRERVDKRGKTLIKKLNKIGYVVEYRNVRKKYGYPVMKIHVIYYLSNNCKNKKLFEELRKEVYSPKGRAYFEIKFDKTEKIIHAIIKAHGVPVLAHPWFTKNWDCRIGKLVKAGLKGIEINSPMSDKIKNRKEIVKKIRVYSKRYNLINTSGSDFHAVDRNNFNLKKHGCDYKIVEKLRRMTETKR